MVDILKEIHCIAEKRRDYGQTLRDWYLVGRIWTNPHILESSGEIIIEDKDKNKDRLTSCSTWLHTF